MSDSLQPHELQHARPLCLSPTPRVHSDSSTPERFEALCELPASLQNSLGRSDISTLLPPASCSIRLLPVTQVSIPEMPAYSSPLSCTQDPPLHLPDLPGEGWSEVSPFLHPRENRRLVLLEFLKVPHSQTLSMCPPRTRLGKEKDSSGLIEEPETLPSSSLPTCSESTLETRRPGNPTPGRWTGRQQGAEYSS